MRNGFNWLKGPFELLFEYGLDNYIDRLREEDIEIPNLFSTMSRLKQQPYDSSSSQAYTHDAGMKFISRDEGVRLLLDHKKYANPISKNYASTIWQLADDPREQQHTCL